MFFQGIVVTLVFLLQDLASVLECVIDEVFAEAVTEVAHDGVRYTSTAIV